jgi:hypothetical protein
MALMCLINNSIGQHGMASPQTLCVSCLWPLCHFMPKVNKTIEHQVTRFRRAMAFFNVYIGLQEDNQAEGTDIPSEAVKTAGQQTVLGMVINFLTGISISQAAAGDHHHQHLLSRALANFRKFFPKAGQYERVRIGAWHAKFHCCLSAMYVRD